jgi:hypothetical protein
MKNKFYKILSLVIITMSVLVNANFVLAQGTIQYAPFNTGTGSNYDSVQTNVKLSPETQDEKVDLKPNTNEETVIFSQNPEPSKEDPSSVNSFEKNKPKVQYLQNNFNKNQDSYLTVINPAREDNIVDFIFLIADIAIQIGAVVAVLAIIYTGFKFVMARGSDTEVSKAKSLFFYNVVGIAVLFGAKIISEIIQATVSAISKY